MSRAEAHGAIEAVWRIEQRRLIAGLAGVVRDVGLAEDLAQEALVIALEKWPESGVPENPGAWLMATARNRGIDRLRRDRRLDEKYAEIAAELERDGVGRDAETAGIDSEPDLGIDDDVLSLLFTTCHPVLSTESQVALTLRLAGGLGTEEIARAFLVSKSTLAQRIVRAKRTLSEARVPFEVPHGAELEQRLTAVLRVIYLIFNEGYSATSGEDWMRPQLCLEALRLGRVLAELAPGSPEVHGLVALMEIQASRTAARADRRGRPILLMDQDRSRWDRLLIRRGFAAMERAELTGRALGPYSLQAEIAACHARALRPEETDWLRIAALYDALVQVSPSPVVDLNRAVAVSMAFGPAAGLEIVDRLGSDPALKGYHLLPGVRGDLLARLGRSAEAVEEFERAALLTGNERERELLLERAAGCRTD